MTRAQALAVVAAHLRESDRVIIANGAMGRDFFACGDSPRHFYLVGSMGLAASVGVGVALQKPDLRVVVLDGDGNLMMGLGGLLLAGGGVTNLLHLVVDNGAYATTGGQPTNSRGVDFESMALGAGYGYACRVTDNGTLTRELTQWERRLGPVFLRIEVSPQTDEASPRLPYTPGEIAARFRETE